MEEHPKWSDTQTIIALTVTFSFIAVVVIWMFYPPQGDPGAIAVLNTLVGSLGTGFGMVLTYFFGSSKGSSTKDDTIARMAGTAETAGEKANGANGGPLKTDEVNVTTETTNIKEK